MQAKSIIIFHPQHPTEPRVMQISYEVGVRRVTEIRVGYNPSLVVEVTYMKEDEPNNLATVTYVGLPFKFYR